MDEKENLNEDALNGIWEETEETDQIRNTIQIYLENNFYNHGIITGDDAQFDSVSFQKNTNCDAKKEETGEIVNDEDRLRRWIVEHWSDYALAFIIASAVFSDLPYIWVVEAADKLYANLKREDAEQSGMALVLVLKQFGAEKCPGVLRNRQGKVPVDIVHFAQEANREKVLNCIWIEFPQTRDLLNSWLKEYICGPGYLMAEKAQKAAALFAYQDYFYFTQTTIRQLYRDKSMASDMIVARIVLELLEHEELQQNIRNMLSGWNNVKNADYLLANMLICTEHQEYDFILDGAIRGYVKRAYAGVEKNRSNEYLKKLYVFFGAGVRRFVFYRILIETLYALCSGSSALQDKRNITFLFLSLFAIDVNLAKVEEGEEAIFIKICFVNHEASEQLAQLWKTARTCRDYREDFYRLLGAYAARLKEEERGKKIKDFIRTVFNDCSAEMQRDIAAKVETRCRRNKR